MTFARLQQYHHIVDGACYFWKLSYGQLGGGGEFEAPIANLQIGWRKLLNAPPATSAIACENWSSLAQNILTSFNKPHPLN